tara:strand:- start:5579 stop:6526 length:948 start_codon:yes stop_codon:yes gene_type:complete
LNLQSIFTFNITFSTLLFFHLSSVAVAQNDSTTTVKFFKTHLKREQILTHEIYSDEAEEVNHFKAEYNTDGKLIKVEYVSMEEETDRGIKFKFSKPTEPFTYYSSWNPMIQNLEGELSENSLGDTPYYRASYIDSVHLKSVEFYNKKDNRLWTYYLKWNRDKTEATLYAVFDTHQPITSLEPHLFSTTLSEMRPGWFARFNQDTTGNPLSVSVSDIYGTLYYYYRFSYSSPIPEDTLSQEQNDITTSYYFKADSTLMGKHTLLFLNNRLIKKEFFDSEGNLLETIEYDYDSEADEVYLVVRDSKGKLLYRQVMLK